MSEIVSPAMIQPTSSSAGPMMRMGSSVEQDLRKALWACYQATGEDVSSDEMSSDAWFEDAVGAVQNQRVECDRFAEALQGVIDAYRTVEDIH